MLSVWYEAYGVCRRQSYLRWGHIIAYNLLCNTPTVGMLSEAKQCLFATSAQKLAQETEMVLPQKPSEGLPSRPIREKTLL